MTQPEIKKYRRRVTDAQVEKTLAKLLPKLRRLPYRMCMAGSYPHPLSRLDVEDTRSPRTS